MTFRLTLLIACLALGACADPDRDWELAARDDTPVMYLEFLAKHADAEQADQARNRIRELKVIRAWERAEFKASLDGYRGFIVKHPDSEFVAEARDRIAALERDEQWEFIDGSTDKAVLASFIQLYPDAPQKAQAELQLEEILVAEEAARPKERPGAFRLQLATFRTALSADHELRRLVAMFPDTFLGPIRIETPGANASGGLFLLKTVPMTGAEARAVCAELKARRQECLLVNR
jgi:hypothetical protein